MLQKVLKFANYAVAVFVKKLCFFAPIMPKIMLAQSANAYQAVSASVLQTSLASRPNKNLMAFTAVRRQKWLNFY